MIRERKSGRFKNGSITVMMSLVLFMILSLMLVTLEHAYQYAGRTLAFQTMNKAIESVLGRYYAPLYTQYGLFAVSIGNGMSYDSIADMENDIAGMINIPFYESADDDTEGCVWNIQVISCKTDNRTDLTDGKGELFKEQIKEITSRDFILEITDELTSLKGQSIDSIDDLLSAAKNSLDAKEDKESGEKEDKEKNDNSSEDGGFWETCNTLKAFFTDGFSGWWFEDAENLSEREIEPFELPSSDYEDEDSEPALFKEPDFSALSFDDGDYLEELIDSSSVSALQNALEEAAEWGTTKVSLASYAAMNMDSYLKNDVYGKMKYEQEYLIFGDGCDENNVKKAGWAVFNIRLIVNLIYLLTNVEMKEGIKELVAGITTISKWASVLLVLLTVVLAAENAIVETAAILKGKKVDFMVSAASQTVKPTEIFTFSKSMIMDKADNYKGVSTVRISYQTYLYLFLLMLNEDLLAYRIMDIIEVNMQKMYNSDFYMSDCLAGFEVDVAYYIMPQFNNLNFYLGDDKYKGYIYRMSSAIAY
ncbi:MAG: DUF5702 domain-containing protein [Lachnospiraceae bacterium]